MREFSPVVSSIDEEMVAAAFAEFYDYFTRSQHYKSYFESEEQVCHLIEAQKKAF